MEAGESLAPSTRCSKQHDSALTQISKEAYTVTDNPGVQVLVLRVETLSHKRHVDVCSVFAGSARGQCSQMNCKVVADPIRMR